MMCFRDKSFCSARCLNTECHRNWNDELQKAADKWWGKPGAPIAFQDYSPYCKEYQPCDVKPAAGQTRSSSSS